jgi:hypothetical protein
MPSTIDGSSTFTTQQRMTTKGAESEKLYQSFIAGAVRENVRNIIRKVF